MLARKPAVLMTLAHRDLAVALRDVGPDQHTVRTLAEGIRLNRGERSIDRVPVAALAERMFGRCFERVELQLV